MSYGVNISGGSRLSGLASSTPCVLVIGNLLATFPTNWSYATVAGSTFTFFAAGNSSPSGSMTLSLTTLAAAVAGATVLVDNGSGNGHWQVGTVAFDGTTTSTSSGPIPASAQAAVPLAGQSLPAHPTSVSLAGTASNGSLWFLVNQLLLVACGAMTTVGAVPAGTTAFVNNGSWQLISL